MKRALFLDRDGTLIEHVHYLKNPEHVRLLPSVVKRVKEFQQQGYLLILVTNQSGLSRGLIKPEEYDAVHARLVNDLARQGVRLDDALFCASHPDANDPRRKPEPGMILEAAQKYGIDLAQSIMVGDSPADWEAGRRAGVGKVLGVEHFVSEGSGGAPTLYILCGGMGKRLGAITRHTPKPLIRIGGKPFLERLIHWYAPHFGKIVLVAGYKGEEFEALASKNVKLEIETSAMGTGGWLASSRSSLPEEFYVCNGDTFLDPFGMGQFMEKMNEPARRAGSLLVVSKQERKAKGSVVLEKEKIIDFAEKSGEGEGWAYAGLARLRKKDLPAGRELPVASGGALSLEHDVFPKLARERKLSAYCSEASIFDIGTVRGIKRFKELIGVK